MDRTTIKNFTVGSFIFSVISLFILAFGKIDYNISLLLLNRKASWAEFFYVFGEQPAYWGLLIGTVILLSAHKSKNKAGQICYSAASLLFSFLGVYLLIIIPTRYIYDLMNSPVPTDMKATVAAVAAVISICITVIVPQYEARLKKFRLQALFLIMVIITEMLLVGIMKDIWGRPRMRSISGFKEFRYWYEIAGPAAGQEYKSFPSGHSAKSFTMIAFCVFVPQGKKIRFRLFIAFSVIWGILVAISRVVLGAHFLSDVIAGFFVTMACIYYYCNLLFNGHKRVS